MIGEWRAEVLRLQGSILRHIDEIGYGGHCATERDDRGAAWKLGYAQAVNDVLVSVALAFALPDQVRSAREKRDAFDQEATARLAALGDPPC